MARERYLRGAGEETIHSNVIKADTGKAKAQNWWYYNKKKLFIGILCGALVVSFICSVIFKVHPDYTVAIMSGQYVDDSALKVLENSLTPYGEDVNGDGKVVVRVLNYSVATQSGDSSYDVAAQQAVAVRFAADISTGESMIWLHDEVGYYCMGEQENLFQTINPKADENDMIPWKDVKALKKMDFEGYESEYLNSQNMVEIFSKLRISFREKDGSAIEKSEKLTEYHGNSKKLFENLLADKTA